MAFKTTEDKICDNLIEAVENMEEDKLDGFDIDEEKLKRLITKMEKACMYRSYPEKQLSRRHSIGGKRRKKRRRKRRKTRRRTRRKTRRRRRRRGGNPITHKCEECGDQFNADNGNMNTWKCPSCEHWTLYNPNKPGMKKEYSAKFERERKRDKVRRGVANVVTYALKHGERAAKRKRTNKQRRYAPLRLARRVRKAIRRTFKKTPPTTPPIVAATANPTPLTARPQLLGNRNYPPPPPPGAEREESGRWIG